MKSGSGRLLVIAAAGLDWRLLVDGSSRGLMPCLAALGRRGLAVPVRASSPLSALAAFGEIATGMPAERHGIFYPEEGWEGGVRPTGHASWLVPPIWEALAAEGIASAAVNWPASGPGAAWQAAVVDVDYPAITGSNPDRWAMAPDCVPLPLREELRDARVHPADIDGTMLLPLLPDLRDIDQATDLRPSRIATAMARAATVQAAAIRLIGDGARAAFVHHDWFAAIRAVAGHREPSVGDASDGALRFLDRLVEGLVAAIGPDATILIVAPGMGTNGALIGAGRSIEWTGGPAVASLGDVVPTALAHFGYRDPVLQGSSLIGCETSERPAYDPTPPAPRPMAAPPEWRAAKLTQLAELVLLRDPAEASAFVDAALAIHPDSVGALSVAAATHVVLGAPEKLAPIADALARVAPDRHYAAMVRGIEQALRGDARAARPWLDQAAASGDGATLVRVGGAWLMLKRPAEAERAFAAAEADPSQASAARLGLSTAAQGKGMPALAEPPLRRLLASDPANVVGWLELARILGLLGRSREAEAARARAIGLGAEPA